MKSFRVIVGFTFGFTVIGAMLVGGFTAAKIFDPVQESKDVFTSGNLEVTLDKPNGEPYFDISDIVPGDRGSAEVIVSNTGSVDLAYILNLTYSGDLVEGQNHLAFSVYDESGDIVDLTAKRNLSVGEQETLIIEWRMPLEAGNEYQNATAELDISVVAEQIG